MTGRGLLAAFRGELYRCFAMYRDASSPSPGLYPATRPRPVLSQAPRPVPGPSLLDDCCALQRMAPYLGQARCLALGFWPECFQRLNVKGGRRPFPKET